VSAWETEDFRRERKGVSQKTEHIGLSADLDRRVRLIVPNKKSKTLIPTLGFDGVKANGQINATPVRTGSVRPPIRSMNREQVGIE